MTDMTLGERLAVLEVQMDTAMEHADDRADVQNQILQEFKHLKDDLSDIKSQLNHYKGFLGGVVFLASALGMFLYKCGLPIYTYLVRLKTG